MDTIPPDAFLAGFPAPIAAIGRRLGEAVLAAVPGALERVRPGWRLVGYDVPGPRRAAYFAYVAPEHEHIHLGFEHGHLMDDPDGRLLGTGVTRQVRWLTFLPGDRVDPDDLAPLIREAARVALLSRDERLAVAMSREP